MTNGVGEQVGKATTATIDALKSTPVVLAILVFNLMFMALLGWITMRHANQLNEEVERWASVARSCLPPQQP